MLAIPEYYNTYVKLGSIYIVPIERTHLLKQIYHIINRYTY